MTHRSINAYDLARRFLSMGRDLTREQLDAAERDRRPDQPPLQPQRDGDDAA